MKFFSSFCKMIFSDSTIILLYFAVHYASWNSRLHARSPNASDGYQRVMRAINDFKRVNIRNFDIKLCVTYRNSLQGRRMYAGIDKTSSLLSKRPWARGLSDTIYCGRIDVCSSDFHVREFRRNSQPCLICDDFSRICYFFHAPLWFSL